jgi:hypothetical protein
MGRLHASLAGRLVATACALSSALAPVLASGCGRSYPSPFTAEEMAKDGTGDALAHYLHQPGATAAVCDRRSNGPHLGHVDPAVSAALVSGLGGGDIRPDLFRRCAMLMLESVPPAESAALLEAMAHTYRSLVGKSAVETDAGLKERLEALHRTFLDRPAGTDPRPAAVEEDIAKLRAWLAGGKAGPFAAEHGRDILRTIELSRGQWDGAPLTAATLDALAAKKDEAMLRRIAVRVPGAELRGEAKRRIVRLHIAASPVPEVHAHAAEVEARVLEEGRNALDVAKNAPAAAWLDEEHARVRGVLVRQDLWKQTVQLFAVSGDKPGASLLPSLGLRGAFFARVAGFSDPVTLCAPPEALDVTPCLLPSDLHPAVPIVYVDAEGLLHFVERVTVRDAMRLVYETPNLPLPFEIEGRTVLTVEWPIVFERPEPLVFNGPAGGRSPDLRVTLERRYGPRLLFEVAGPAGKLAGIVETNDLDAFEITTRGGSGTPGSRGTDGSAGASGSAGSAASCPGSRGGNGGNGSPGGNGTSGGPGSAGGPGGDVTVHVACTTGDCAGLVDRVKRLVRSEGGAGGPGGDGGRGGRGGDGGPGGSGTSCSDGRGGTTFLSGGSPGTRGSDGSPGSHGSNGTSGPAGRVTIHAAG